MGLHMQDTGVSDAEIDKRLRAVPIVVESLAITAMNSEGKAKTAAETSRLLLVTLLAKERDRRQSRPGGGLESWVQLLRSVAADVHDHASSAWSNPSRSTSSGNTPFSLTPSNSEDWPNDQSTRDLLSSLGLFTQPLE